MCEGERTRNGVATDSARIAARSMDRFGSTAVFGRDVGVTAPFPVFISSSPHFQPSCLPTYVGLCPTPQLGRSRGPYALRAALRPSVLRWPRNEQPLGRGTADVLERMLLLRLVAERVASFGNTRPAAQRDRQARSEERRVGK